jgi:PAS domain S-box-containing protein
VKNINNKNNDLIQPVLDSLSAHVAVLNKNGVISYVNKAWKDFALANGLTEENCCLGVNYLDTITEAESREDFNLKKEIKAVMTGKKDFFTYEYPCHSSQKKRWFEMRVTPFLGDQNYQIVISHENITERKLKSIELKRQRKFNDNILKNLTEMIIYMDPDFNIRWTNQSAADYLNPEELIGQKCYEKWNYYSHCLGCPLLKAKKSKKVEESIMEKPDGSVWRMKAIPDLDENDEIKGFIEVVLDITKEHKQERKIKQVVSKLEEQFEKAGKLHDQFLPTRTPKFDELTIATYYSPAERLGGDFYNFIKLENYLIFYISDVSGHDLSGSMLNIFLKETINTYLISNNICKNTKMLHPAKILSYINQRYNEETFPEDYFICLMLGVLDLNTNKITFANAGVQFSPLLIKQKAKIEKFPCGGMPISFVSSGEYTVCNLKLEAGDAFFLNTDGLIEQTNGIQNQIYGQKRLINVLEKNTASSPAQIIEAIYSDFLSFRDKTPVQDDVTFLIIKRDPAI